MENCRKYKIPLRYEEGTYKLGNLIFAEENTENGCFNLEYDSGKDIITLKEKFVRTYGLGIDPSESIIVEYRSPYAFFQKGKGINLEKIYAQTKDGKKLMMYWGVEEVYSNRRDDIFEMIQDITVRSANELTEGLKEAPSPFGTLHDGWALVRATLVTTTATRERSLWSLLLCSSSLLSNPGKGACDW